MGDYSEDVIIHSQALSLLRLLKKDASKFPRYFGSDASLKAFIAQFENLVKLLTKYPAGSCVDILGLENLVEPFLSLLQSEDAHGHVVEAAIDSLNFFFVQCDMLQLIRERERQALLYRRIIQIVTSCRFEPSDPTHDEVVLSKNAALILDLFQMPESAHFLEDRDLVAIFESVLALVFLPRFSDHLKLHSERILLSIVRSVFSRFAELQDNTSLYVFDCFGKREESVPASPVIDMTKTASQDNSSSTVELTPYTKAPLVSFLKYLSQLLGMIESKKHKDRIKLSTLYILEAVIVEHQCRFAKDPMLLQFIEKDCWKSLLLVSPLLDIIFISLDEHSGGKESRLLQQSFRAV